jgi:adenomatosis polyposis coli protein
LSLDDEPKITTDTLTKEMRLMNHPSEDQEDQEDPPAQLSDVENEESLPEPPTTNDLVHLEDVLTDGEESANDVMLLESCINIGMNRGRADQQRISNNDSFQQYCTEDTPALLSKTGSNTNLSILSLDTNKGETVLSDDSSNTSDAGNDELLKECIQVGMPKPSSSSTARNLMSLPQQGGSQKPKPKERRTMNLLPQQMSMENPIEKMRSGGGFGAGGSMNVAAASAATTSSMHHHLPPYLPVKDEMNKFLVEDSPCNFSVMSALSDLTVGSGVAGLTKMKR